ncbi:2-keto-4-pentenoate hydratase/2-oxohepta-3-ene-1,7-dioic acid hydratase [Desulfitobacterium dichloroeliminans LMG P-21439]|uniref:2-keto-4-pentenoate hydratase/2-oxohepta-3-ene-1,7-dioic acid hydratase n=1 Tax=Desulfitobacterium dichloroeliminans (strain LMG P-21439 / DCA1) TaxID=871963 RepID=L0F702_DESDL|nr:fumarylacetoacetate hydrolase family protein [Desulfitobacterium dichloroeliminans]AGA68431.1 2-keto-4-pentenoate hydratase/2-oxohepta-3-ene-1,7-dioic acid hydratase [Desulfitobacterium dichloroeliminans LMG P-21439]
MSLRNIYCVGRNYRLHAEELNNAVPEAPLIFTKPTHAYTEAKGQIIKMPTDKGAVHYEVELVIHLDQDYEEGMSADELIDKISIGVDFTLRELQEELKKKGYPWLPAKGFPNSALCSPWMPFAGLEAIKEYDFALLKNGQEVQHGNIKDMIFDIPEILEYVAKEFGLGAGDVIFTGTPAGVGKIQDGDHLILKWQDTKVGECQIGF